jgi:hypothetical protein
MAPVQSKVGAEGSLIAVLIASELTTMAEGSKIVVVLVDIFSLEMLHLFMAPGEPRMADKLVDDTNTKSLFVIEE